MTAKSGEPPEDKYKETAPNALEKINLCTYLSFANRVVLDTKRFSFLTWQLVIVKSISIVFFRNPSQSAPSVL